MFIQMYEEKYMRFPEGKEKALTFSYDDGVEADRRLLEIFKKYALKGTFNLNSKTFDAQCWHKKLNEEETYKLYSDCGQEIALHGARHIFLDKVPLAEAAYEVISNREYLEKKFERTVRGMAYAYGAFNEDIKRVLRDSGVAYARTTRSTFSFGIPDDWLEWNPTCHHTDEEFAALTEKFLSFSPSAQLKHREPLLYYVWGHSFEFDDHDNWDSFVSFAQKISGREDIWYATNMEIRNYAEAYKNLVFSLDGERAFNSSYMPVWIEIRGKVYKIDGGKEVVFDK